MRALLSKQEEPSLYQSIIFHTFWNLISPHWNNALKYILLYFSNLEFQRMRHTFPVRLQQVFILFGWNLARMLPDNVAKKSWRGICIFGFLRKYWLYKQRQCVFYKNLKFNSVLKTNQTSNQNSPTTQFFRSRCDENVEMSLALSR